MEIEEMSAIDSAAALTNKNIRIAVVATNPDVLAAANTYASSSLTVIPTKVFCSMSEARAWLGQAAVWRSPCSGSVERM